MGIKEYSFTGKTLLDVGCNVGHMLFEATICGFPISYGLEQAPRIVEAGNAIADYLRALDRITIQQADANSLTVDALIELTGEAQFDVVFCFAVDGYVSTPKVFYKLLTTITKEVLYFEPNNHKIDWGIDFIKSWGFKTVEMVTVPYDKSTGSTRNCFICRK
jgi:SAM-dependent methyltransferase